MHCQLRWAVASMVVLDSKSIADGMVFACRKSLRDLSGVKPPILYSVYGPIHWHQPESQVACVYECKAHGSLSLYDDPRMTNSARLQRTV